MKPFRYYLRVRYGECDAQKVVFNARFGDYVDVAVNEFIRAIGLAGSLIDGDLDFQLVKQTTEWMAPARFDDVLEIAVEPVRLGTTSFTLRAVFRRAGADGVIATAETVYVLVDAKTLQKTPLDERLRRAFEHGARGVVTDHAGFAPRS